MNESDVVSYVLSNTLDSETQINSMNLSDRLEKSTIILNVPIGHRELSNFEITNTLWGSMHTQISD